MENRLIIKRVQPERLREEVGFLLDRLNTKARSRHSDVVLIKPNIFCRDSAETGATTDLQLLSAVIGYFRDLRKKVFVGEAGANQYAQTRMFVELGLETFCRKHGATFLNLNEVPTGPIELVIRGKPRRFLAPRILLEPHVLVDVPKFKTHMSTRVSWAIKNLYGLLPDKEKWRGHQIDIHETLLALSRRFPAHVVLMDGIIAMKGLGPTMGLPEPKNLLFAAPDQFVHDYALLKLLNLRHVPHIEQAFAGKNPKIQYEFLDQNGAPTTPEALNIDLKVPPLLFSLFFIRSNQAFFTLAPFLERFFDPKIILNLLVHQKLIRFIRNVQKLLKI